ncbi:hypothetical protein SynRS9902_02108 [Synechococcus sp. RS9902]|nr:hypothetical protein SynRS9902_02108 [Synechococcus sp. RS9902]
MCAHLQLGATKATSADDRAADAQTQRHCGLGQDAANRVATVPAPSALRVLLPLLVMQVVKVISG